MKNKSIFRIFSKESILVLSLLFTIIIEATAQNSSYNANTIPIGGSASTAFGFEALKVNIGPANTATGYQALFSNTTGNSNTAIGYIALYNNLTGNANTAMGWGALNNNTSGNSNTAIGLYALHYNDTGNLNTANGHSALFNNTGSRNTANGQGALFNNTLGSYNTANGQDALYSNTLGFYNTANGVNALFYNTTGDFNTANGYHALYSNTTGSQNVAIGDSAGFNNSGSANIYLGKRAGYYESGSDKIYIGNDSNRTIIYGDMSTGQLLLGNKQPNGYTFKGTRTLNVLGGILADSVRVALSGDWADHVFDDDYQLMSLDELSNFIKTNKRLPNVPSAKDVADNGVNLVTMDARLLEKIEELTLYVLELKKENQQQQEEINSLKTRMR